MNPGSTQSISVYCTPNTSELIETEIIVEFLPASLGKVYIAVQGQGENVNVVLSTNTLNMDPSFITLLAHRTLKIQNLSSEPVTYTWKSCSTVGEEDQERERLLYEINRMESVEKNILLERIPLGGFENFSEKVNEDEIIALGEKVKLEYTNICYFLCDLLIFYHLFYYIIYLYILSLTLSYSHFY